MDWKLGGLIVVACLAAGCAKGTKDIKAHYVSPLEYKDYDCEQIAAEMRRVGRRVSELGGSVDKTAKGDQVAMGVGLVLFWPALFFLDGDTPEAQEYARLKGVHDALQEAAIQKKCGIEVQQVSSEAASAG